MLDINKNNINEWSIKQNIKNEQYFAKAIVTRYKMSNTRNKNFVNIMLIDIKEIEQYFNLQLLLLLELNKLEFLTINVNDLIDKQLIKNKNNNELIAIFKKDETRMLKFNKLFTVSQFL